MIDSSEGPPTGRNPMADTDTRPGLCQAEEAATVTRQWVSWDTWLASYEEALGSGRWSGSGSAIKSNRG